MSDIKTSIVPPIAKSCSAKIDFEKDPNETLQSFAEYVAKSKGNVFNPVLMPVLVVEERKTIKRAADWAREARSDAMILESPDISDKEFSELLLQYYEKHGPLFKEDRLPIREIRQRLQALSMFLWAYVNTMWVKSASAPVVNMIYGSYLSAVESYPEHKGPFVVHQMYEKKKGFYYYMASPKARGDRGFVLKYIDLPENPDEKYIQKWCQVQCISILDRLVKARVQTDIKLDKRNGLILTLRPGDLYTSIILDIAKNDFPQFIAKEEASNDLKQRRAAVAVFRTRKGRGTITELENDKLLKYSRKLIGLDKDLMVEKLEAYLKEIRKTSRKRSRKSPK